MSVDDLQLTDEEIAELTPNELQRYAAILASARAELTGPTAWRDQARPEQLPPEGEWTQLLFARWAR